MKQITLCADDYGQNPAISQAIVALAESGRLTATSCMVNSDYWQLHAKWLNPLKQKIDIGLHINFTQGTPLSQDFQNVYGDSFFSLNNLLMRSVLGQLNLQAIEVEMHAQMDRFIEGSGRLPDFIDGHQHVHQFPIMRTAFLNVYEARLRKQKSYVRSVYNPNAISHIGNGAFCKEILIQWSGAKKFRDQLIQLNIPHNASFSGVYSFHPKINYAKIFPRFLDEVTEGGLIMCHPGLPLCSDSDPIFAARQQEFAYFSSEIFLADCQSKEIKIAK